MRLRTRGSSVAEASPREEALAVVDTALMFARRREVFTTDEALELLQGLRNKVQDPAVSELLAPFVAAAEADAAGSPLVDRSRVVDHLLDLRLALTA